MNAPEQVTPPQPLVWPVRQNGGADAAHSSVEACVGADVPAAVGSAQLPPPAPLSAPRQSGTKRSPHAPARNPKPLTGPVGGI